MARSLPYLSFVPGCLSKMIFLIFPPSLLPGSLISLVVVGFTKAAQDRSALPCIKSSHTKSRPSQVSPMLVVLHCMVLGVRLPQESSLRASPPLLSPCTEQHRLMASWGQYSWDISNPTGRMRSPASALSPFSMPSSPSRRGHKLTAGKEEPCLRAHPKHRSLTGKPKEKAAAM